MSFSVITLTCFIACYEQVLEQTIAAICHDLPHIVAGVDFPQLDTVKNYLTAAITSSQQTLAQLPQLTADGDTPPSTG